MEEYKYLEDTHDEYEIRRTGGTVPVAKVLIYYAEYK
jgi:hypothetical protein